jgi:hypothetical protein
VVGSLQCRLDKLEAVLAQGTNDLSKIVPLLADLLSIPNGDRYPPLNLTPHKRKEKTLHLAQVASVAMLLSFVAFHMPFVRIVRGSLDLNHTNVVNAKVHCLCARWRPWHNGFDKPQPASGLCRRNITPARAFFACSQRQS